MSIINNSQVKGFVNSKYFMCNYEKNVFVYEHCTRFYYYEYFKATNSNTKYTKILLLQFIVGHTVSLYLFLTLREDLKRIMFHIFKVDLLPL